MGDAGNSVAFEREVPLTGGRTFGDLLDLGAAFAAQVTSHAGSDAPDDGGPSFATAQQLAALIADNVRYVDDPIAGPTLVFDVGFEHLFEVATYPLEFDIDLGDLSGISVGANSNLAVEADAAVNLSFGVALRKPGANFQLTESKLLGALNGGQGVDIDASGDDIEFILRDGTRFAVDLAGAVDVGSVIDRVHAAAQRRG